MPRAAATRSSGPPLACSRPTRRSMLSRVGASSPTPSGRWRCWIFPPPSASASLPATPGRCSSCEDGGNPMQTREIKVKLRDGEMGAYLAIPDRTPAGAIIAIMEIWGVNDTMRHHAHEFAQAGFLCLVPDLFWRQEPGVELCYLMCCRTDIDCAVAYYGTYIEHHIRDAKNLHRPFLLHMAMRDRWVQAEVNDLIERRLSPNPLVAIHKYPGADHAFARLGGKTYSKPEADRALGLTLDFFSKHLA